MIGRCHVLFVLLLRILRVASMPSRLGMWISISTTSTCRCCSWFNASLPSFARITSQPNCSSMRCPASRLIASSSTSSTRMPCKGIPSASLSAPSLSCCARERGSSNQNVLPRPYSDFTPIRPHMASTRCLLIASPSPVPPWVRAGESSSCENR